MSTCTCGKPKKPQYPTCYACSEVDKCECGKYKKKAYPTCYECRKVAYDACPMCGEDKETKYPTCYECRIKPPRRDCEVCGGPLVAIGTARRNGKGHSDWTSRTMHKKCWKNRLSCVIREYQTGDALRDSLEHDDSDVRTYQIPC